MKRKPILIGTIIFVLYTATLYYAYYLQEQREKTKYTPKVQKETKVTIQNIADDLNYGLYKIKVDDSTTVLLYNDRGGATMIKY
jgi:hypothetical protein